MKSTYFGNKKALQIISTNVRNDIKSSIQNLGPFNLISKYYTFLNKKNVNNLKETDFQVTLSTFGKKYIMYITDYNSKKYCLFINKKNDCITLVQLKFSEDIFKGSLFDGELVKNSNDQWIFLINDMAYYKGTNYITSSFEERKTIIEDFLENEYEYDSDQGFFISNKPYFSYEYLKDLTNTYMNLLNYKCSGLYFKNINNFSDNYLFIFPECRSDSKILKNGTVLDDVNTNSMKSIKLESDDDEDELMFGKVEVIVKDDKPAQQQSLPKLEKTVCRFLINSTGMPDVYELYCKSNNNNIEKYSYAAVPDIDTSNFLQSLFPTENTADIYTKVDNGTAVYVECNYHKSFKKWVPYKRVNSMDTLNSINQIQIILDSI